MLNDVNVGLSAAIQTVSNSCPIVHVAVKGHRGFIGRVPTLLDTGSDANFIRESLFQKLRRKAPRNANASIDNKHSQVVKVQRLKRPIRISGIGGEAFRVEEEFVINVKLPNTKQVAPVHFLRMPDGPQLSDVDIILGVPGMRQFRINLDFGVSAEAKLCTPVVSSMHKGTQKMISTLAMDQVDRILLSNATMSTDEVSVTPGVKTVANASDFEDLLTNDELDRATHSKN